MTESETLSMLKATEHSFRLEEATTEVHNCASAHSRYDEHDPFESRSKMSSSDAYEPGPAGMSADAGARGPPAVQLLVS